ncbi:helix-turn-helix transcriptional regulator [Phenylobacterium sp.]|uniref:helix-turn-helix transcriptional regulator n=1 Tax=Phenylobacterium sp. TaxID=1871053 RepID=UPI002FD94E47
MTSRSSRPCAPASSDAAILALQTEVWTLVRRRFDLMQARHGLSQAALAAQLGVTPAQVSLWLRDPKRMTIKAAARLLFALEASLHCHLEPGDQGPR